MTEGAVTILHIILEGAMVCKRGKGLDVPPLRLGHKAESRWLHLEIGIRMRVCLSYPMVGNS